MKVDKCPRCWDMAALEMRDYTLRAQRLLVNLHEAVVETFTSLICLECHDEMREILIDNLDLIDRLPVNEVQETERKNGTARNMCKVLTMTG